MHVSLIAENEKLYLKIHNTGSALPDDLLEWIKQTRGNKHADFQLVVKVRYWPANRKKILQLHGSSLQASTDETGNLFSFSLPVYIQ